MKIILVLVSGALAAGAVWLGGDAAVLLTGLAVVFGLMSIQITVEDLKR